MTTYAITGATGKFGKRALATLAQLVPDAHIIGLARNTDKASKTVPAGVEVRKGDYTDKSSLITALTGVDKLLFVSSVPGGNMPRQEQHQNVIDAAKEAGVSYTLFIRVIRNLKQLLSPPRRPQIHRKSDFNGWSSVSYGITGT